MSKPIVDKVKVGVSIQKQKKGIDATFNPPIDNQAFKKAAEEAGVVINYENNKIVSIFGTKEQIEGLIGYEI